MIGLTEWLFVILAALLIGYCWIKYHYSFWSRKNVPHIEPTPFLGNFKEMITLTCNAGDHLKNLYNTPGMDTEPIIGIHIFNRPGLLIREPEIVKSILVKDFGKFSDRYSSSDPHLDGLGSYNLFFVNNPQWKEIRTKLTPVFTSGKIKQMFPLIDEIGRQLDSYLCALPVDAETHSSEQELREISALYTTDVIATVAYGIQANSLKNPNGDFRSNGRKIFKFTPMRALEFISIFFLPHMVRLFRSKVFSKESSKFLRDTMNYVIGERERSNTTRNDLIDTLIGLKRAAAADVEKKHFALNNDYLVAQAAIFFTAGFETSSSTMSFALYELSKRQDLQERLREEIRQALIRHSGKVTYDMINEMTYLNMVIQEVLRLYPPLPFLDRECTLSEGESDFSIKPFSNNKIPHGMPVYIPIFGFHRDPKYFPNPETFNPERFSEENRKNIVPFTYLPFGTGPRNCIGERFGLLQAKVGLINFLRNHYVSTCPKTNHSMTLDSRALIIQPMGGIYCNIVRDPLVLT